MYLCEIRLDLSHEKCTRCAAAAFRHIRHTAPRQGARVVGGLEPAGRGRPARGGRRPPSAKTLELGGGSGPPSAKTLVLAGDVLILRSASAGRPERGGGRGVNPYTRTPVRIA